MDTIPVSREGMLDHFGAEIGRCHRSKATP